MSAFIGGSWQRHGGWSGIAFVVVWAVGFVVRGETQMYDTPTADLRRYWQESGDRYIAVQYVVLLAAFLLFLPYAVALTEHLGRAEGEPRLWSKVSRDVLGTRTPPAGELLTAETWLIDLANLWIVGLEAEERIEQTTINEYRRVLDNLALPSVGGLKLREATTGRLDRLLLRLGDQSLNRQRKAKVVLAAMLDLAVRHDAIPTNPARGTSRVHRPKQETKALRVEDLVEIRAAVRRWVNADRPGPKATGDMADIIDLMLATGCRIGEILALRWSDLNLDGDLPILTVSGTIKTETGKGTYRKATPKTDASRRTVVLPRFAADLLRVRREYATPNEHDAVFATRNGTWHQVVNVERRWRQIRKDTGYEWVTPHTFRKTVATLISEAATSELASRQLGHSSSQVTRDHYIAKPPVSADLSEVLERLAESDDARSDS